MRWGPFFTHKLNKSILFLDALWSLNLYAHTSTPYKFQSLLSALAKFLEEYGSTIETTNCKGKIFYEHPNILWEREKIESYKIDMID